VDKQWVIDLNNQLPELPFKKARRYADEYHLAEQDIERLIEDKSTADFSKLV